MSIEFENLLTLPPATETERAHIQSRLQTQAPPFVSDSDTMAVIAFGGTIQSAYLPHLETIKPVAMNPTIEKILALADSFGIASLNITGTILVAKDSRDITKSDMGMLIHTISEIKNAKIVVTCGTYMLPPITRVLDHYFGNNKSEKIIGVTGSMLPLSQKEQDADLNIGGTLAAVEMLGHLNQKGCVFAQFHGKIFTNEDLKTLDLHTSAPSLRFLRSFVTYEK